MTQHAKGMARCRAGLRVFIAPAPDASFHFLVLGLLACCLSDATPSPIPVPVPHFGDLCRLSVLPPLRVLLSSLCLFAAGGAAALRGLQADAQNSSPPDGVVHDSRSRAGVPRGGSSVPLCWGPAQGLVLAAAVVAAVVVVGCCCCWLWLCW